MSTLVWCAVTALICITATKEWVKQDSRIRECMAWFVRGVEVCREADRLDVEDALDAEPAEVTL